MDVAEVKRKIEIGRAARNKLIKVSVSKPSEMIFTIVMDINLLFFSLPLQHNLRLVLFTMNKYFQEFTNGPKFQDLCQAGMRGLITAIDRFEPKRKFRLSTYGLFWIRHAIIRSMTTSNFTRVPFGLESVLLYYPFSLALFFMFCRETLHYKLHISSFR